MGPSGHRLPDRHSNAYRSPPWNGDATGAIDCSGWSFISCRSGLDCRCCHGAEKGSWLIFKADENEPGTIFRLRVTTPRQKPQGKKRAVIDDSEMIEITGILRFAEKRAEGKERVGVLDDAGAWHAIHVPAALMSDVIEPLWDMRVTIVARRGKRQVLELETIDPT